LVALLALRIIKSSVNIVVSEREEWIENFTDKKKHSKWSWRFPPTELAKIYSEAKAVVAVSQGVAQGVSSVLNLDKNNIKTIYNPIVCSDLFQKAKIAVEHPWIKEKEFPIILGVGRLVYQKNFSALIKAFALVKKHKPSKLIILGDGKERNNLQQLVHDFNLSEDVDLPGFNDNPYAFMDKSDIFVLSSITEGLPNVLIEALACGCPVISTYCSEGPAEILEYGRYGPMVAVNDEKALAEGIIRVLDNPPNPDWLRKRGWDFSVDKAAEAYLHVAGL